MWQHYSYTQAPWPRATVSMQLCDQWLSCKNVNFIGTNVIQISVIIIIIMIIMKINETLLHLNLHPLRFHSLDSLPLQEKVKSIIRFPLGFQFNTEDLRSWFRSEITFSKWPELYRSPPQWKVFQWGRHYSQHSIEVLNEKQSLAHSNIQLSHTHTTCTMVHPVFYLNQNS